MVIDGDVIMIHGDYIMVIDGDLPFGKQFANWKITHF